MKELIGSVQSYDWGRIGLESKVAQLAQKYAEIDKSKPYAELWMGTVTLFFM
jgi:mannose-6-phosphate isomerase